MTAGRARLAVSFTTAAVAVAIGLAIHAAAVSRAEDPPKPADDSTTLLSRIRAEHDRFLRLYSPLAEIMEQQETLEQALPNQAIKIEGAKAVYENAKLSREVAEIALREYEEGIFKVELARVEGKQKLAESELNRVQIAEAEGRFEKTKAARKAFDDGKPAASLGALGKILLDEAVDRAYARLQVEKISLKQGEFAVEQARTELDVLNRFTKPKRVRELQSEIEKLRRDEVAKEQTYDLEQKLGTRIKKDLTLARWSPDERKLLSILAEVVDLEARLARDPAGPQAGRARPIPTDAEVAKILGPLRSRLAEAERVALAVKQRRGEAEFGARAVRVREVANLLKKQP